LGGQVGGQSGSQSGGRSGGRAVRWAGGPVVGWHRVHFFTVLCVY